MTRGSLLQVAGPRYKKALQTYSRDKVDIIL